MNEATTTLTRAGWVYAQTMLLYSDPRRVLRDKGKNRPSR